MRLGQFEKAETFIKKLIIIKPNEKVINDMVLAGHDVQSIVESNVYEGLEANLKFTTWKRI